MRSTKSKPVTVNLKPIEFVALNELCDAHNASASAFMRMLLIEYLARNSALTVEHIAEALVS